MGEDSAAAARVEVEDPLASLTPEERKRYATDPRFRRLVTTVLTMEPSGVFTRSSARQELYGDDWAREIADLEAGRHPLIQPR